MQKRIAKNDEFSRTLLWISVKQFYTNFLLWLSLLSIPTFAAVERNRSNFARLNNDKVKSCSLLPKFKWIGEDILFENKTKLNLNFYYKYILHNRVLNVLKHVFCHP